MKKGTENTKEIDHDEIISPKENRNNRHYTTIKLPTFEGRKDPESAFQISKELYREVNTNYRHLATIRFRLLGFVPAVSVIVWVQLLNAMQPSTLYYAIVGFVVSILALRIIYGVQTYDTRNNLLYDDLISRGRKIEDDWSVDTGIFKGRLIPYEKDFVNNTISHSRGLSLIYSSVILGWGLISLWYLGHLIGLLSAMESFAI